MTYERIENLFRILLASGFVFGSLGMLTACTDEGPFEEAGEEVDNVIDEIDDEF
jgi:hypothetical protein